MYDPVTDNDDLRQGDVFLEFPVIIIDDGLKHATIVTADGPSYGNDLTQASFDGGPNYNVVATAERTPVILVSQSCDAARENALTVARIRPIRFAVPGFESKSSRNKVDTILKLRDAKDYYYLSEVGDCLGKSIVVFDELLPARRADLLALRRFRRFRLSQEALLHFQHKLGTFFSRYATDDTYMMTQDELVEYKAFIDAAEAKHQRKQAAKDAARSADWEIE